MAKRKDNRTNMEKASDTREGNVPSWVKVLAQKCDEHSQTKIARKVGLSVAVVSQGINNTYGKDGKGRIETLKIAVETYLMEAEVRCPGEAQMIPRTKCEDYWQVSAVRDFGSSETRQDMAACCRVCPHSKLEETI